MLYLILAFLPIIINGQVLTSDLSDVLNSNGSLIKYLKEEFKIKTIFLEVLSSNKRAINIYNKLDFTIISVEPHDKVDNTVKMKLDI